MRTLRLYHICQHDAGENVVLVPKVPAFRALGEDNGTPRVCACLNPYSCLRALELSYSPAMDEPPYGLPVWIYCADVPMEDIEQPSTAEVPDAWLTGELWVMSSLVWHLLSPATFRRHMRFDAKDRKSGASTVFSRYSLTFEGWEETLDRVHGSAVYGDEQAFSYLEFDPSALRKN